MILKPLIQVTVAVALAIGCASASEDPAAKIDNGLGDLPPYSEWKHHPELERFDHPDRGAQAVRHPVRGEKLDSGLGDLPRYSEWKSHPELSRLVVKPAGDTGRSPLASRD